MKKLFTILLALAFTSLSAQHCYTLFKDELKSHTGFNTITFIEESPAGEIIFGGKSSFGGGMGLAYFDGSVVTNFKNSDAADPKNIVRCVAFSGDSTWVGTDGGLGGFISAEYAGWKIYTTTDGLPSNEVTAILILEDGTKWIGFNNGSIASIVDSKITVYDVAFTAINKMVVDLNGRVFHVALPI